MKWLLIICFCLTLPTAADDRFLGDWGLHKPFGGYGLTGIIMTESRIINYHDDTGGRTRTVHDYEVIRDFGHLMILKTKLIFDGTWDTSDDGYERGKWTQDEVDAFNRHPDTYSITTVYWGPSENWLSKEDLIIINECQFSGMRELDVEDHNYYFKDTDMDTLWQRLQNTPENQRDGYPRECALDLASHNFPNQQHAVAHYPPPIPLKDVTMPYDYPYIVLAGAGPYGLTGFTLANGKTCVQWLESAGPAEALSTFKKKDSPSAAASNQASAMSCLS